jgi:hypothetical protein
MNDQFAWKSFEIYRLRFESSEENRNGFLNFLLFKLRFEFHGSSKFARVPPRLDCFLLDIVEGQSDQIDIQLEFKSRAPKKKTILSRESFIAFSIIIFCIQRSIDHKFMIES